MDLGIAGKTALVTASSKGLGKAAAVALAQEGANVVISARGEETLLATAAEIETAGGSVHVMVADVTNPESPDRLVDETLGRYGSLDILVGNAGGPPPMRALEVDEASLTAALNNNLQASLRLVKAAVPHMRANHWGRICLIASNAIKQPIPNNSLSNTARTGLWAWAKTAAQDLFEQGITLNLACPGYHATDRLIELGIPKDKPVGDPAEFGAVVAFLCSQRAAFVSGVALQVDGGAVAGLL